MFFPKSVTFLLDQQEKENHGDTEARRRTAPGLTGGSQMDECHELFVLFVVPRVRGDVIRDSSFFPLVNVFGFYNFLDNKKSPTSLGEVGDE